MKTRFISNALHSVRYFSGGRRGWENTRNKGAFGISVYTRIEASINSWPQGRCQLFLLGSRAWHVRLISYRWADCVNEMMVFTARYHSNPCAHIFTVSFHWPPGVNRQQSLSWKDDNLILLRDGSSDNIWRWECIGDWQDISLANVFVILSI